MNISRNFSPFLLLQFDPLQFDPLQFDPLKGDSVDSRLAGWLALAYRRFQHIAPTGSGSPTFRFRSAVLQNWTFLSSGSPFL